METICDKIITTNLPENLRTQFGELVVNNYEPAKSWVIARVAEHLVRLGQSDLTFRRLLTLPDGYKFYVDVCCENLDLYVLCIVDSAYGWLSNRIPLIRKADAKAKVVVAVQDWLAWAIAEFKPEADDIWVVKRTGEVLRLQDWFDQRRRLLEEDAVKAARELKGLMGYYENVKGVFKELWNAKMELCANVSGRLAELLRAVGVEDISWLSTKEYECESEDMINALRREIRLIERQMLNILVELANKVISVYTPYAMAVTEKGTLYIHKKALTGDWLSWGDKTEAAVLAMQKEIEIMLEAVKRVKQAGEIAPKEKYDLLHFITQSGEWPPQVIRVPRKLLEEMLAKIETMESRLNQLIGKNSK
jgi:hypothetical protein